MRMRMLSKNLLLIAVWSLLSMKAGGAEEIEWGEQFLFTALPSELDAQWTQFGKGTTRIEDGLLVLSTLFKDGGGWRFEGGVGNPRWDGALPITIEFRMKIEEIGVNAKAGAHLVLSDGATLYEFLLDNGTMTTYRLILKDKVATLFEDGSSQPKSVSRGRSLQSRKDGSYSNGLMFGDNSQRIEGISRWEFVRWKVGKAYEP